MPHYSVAEKMFTYLRESIYTGRTKSLVRRLGLNKILSGPYWRAFYLLSGEKKEHTIHGQQTEFRIGNFSEFMRFDNFIGERPIITDVLESLDPGDVFYDVGANVGTYTCFVGSKLQPNNVIAFEPEPKNAVRLRKNLELNDVDAEIIEAALSDTNGITGLALAGDESGEGKHAIETGDASETIAVKMAKADSIIAEQQLPKPTVVKIDVEGAELLVLRGMRNTLQDNCRLVYVEVHPDKIEDFEGTPEEVHSFLEDVGFSVIVLEERGEEYFVKGKKESSFGEQ